MVSSQKKKKMGFLWFCINVKYCAAEDVGEPVFYTVTDHGLKSPCVAGGSICGSVESTCALVILAGHQQYCRGVLDTIILT